MAALRRPCSRQAELFPRPKCSVIEITSTHRLVLITEETDWTELEEIVQAIRRSKLKSEAGRPPHLRALIGGPALPAAHALRPRSVHIATPAVRDGGLRARWGGGAGAGGD